MKALLGIAMMFAVARAALAYDMNGVALGDSERAVQAAFPSAFCRPLEWQTTAADRRCDDGKSSFAGVAARVTFYLKGDAVQAFDVRFDARDRERVAAFLKSRYGEPLSERVETISRPGKADRQTYRARWQKAGDKVLLSVRLGTRFAQLEVSRGDFAERIYRVN